jgi:hypothetical protein
MLRVLKGWYGLTNVVRVANEAVKILLRRSHPGSEIMPSRDRLYELQHKTDLVLCFH